MSCLIDRVRDGGFILSATRSHLLAAPGRKETHDPIDIFKRELWLLCVNGLRKL